jgi:acyl-coenzyme A thioesterase PaaI-like protein
MSIVAGEPGQIQRVNEIVLGHPFHRMAGLQLVRQEPGKAVGILRVHGNTLNMADTLHAGTLYGVMDAISFLALVTLLRPEELAATLDLHISMMRTVRKGEHVELRAEVLRRNPSIAFIVCNAWRLSASGEQLAATANVTKSLTLNPEHQPR